MKHKDFRIYYDPRYHQLIPDGVLEGEHHAYWDCSATHGMNAYAKFWMNAKIPHRNNNPIDGVVTQIWGRDKGDDSILGWYQFATSILPQFKHLEGK